MHFECKATATVIGWFLLVFHVAAPAGAQCVTCHDYSTLDGWVVSPSPFACGPTCEAPWCTKDCFAGAPLSAAAQDDVSPGVLLVQSHGKLVVATVLAGSPAAGAGFAVGDEIVEINGQLPGLGCAASSWRESTNPGTANLTLRRGSEVRTVRLALVAWRELLSPDRMPLSGRLARAHPDDQIEADGSAILEGVGASINRADLRALGYTAASR